MRSSAAQKKQAARLDKNRKARKDARRAERRKAPAPTPPALTPAQAAAVHNARAQLAATRAAVIEDARVARRLAKLCPEVRRRFLRELGPVGFALALHNDIIEVRVTNGPTYGIRVNADGVPAPLVWLGTRRDEHAPLRYETFLCDWATFDVRPGTRHLAKGTVTGRMSCSLPNDPPMRNLVDVPVSWTSQEGTYNAAGDYVNVSGLDIGDMPNRDEIVAQLRPAVLAFLTAKAKTDAAREAVTRPLYSVVHRASTLQAVAEVWPEAMRLAEKFEGVRLADEAGAARIAQATFAPSAK